MGVLSDGALSALSAVASSKTPYSVREFFVFFSFSVFSF
jgi:hypothetical protein